MATSRTLIKAAFRKIGVLASGETPKHDEEQEAFDDIKRMLEAWSTKQVFVYASTEDNFALAAGTASYTMGAGGTASLTRAKKILNAFVRDSGNYDHPVEIISEGQYNAIPSKTTQSRPNRLFYDPTYASGTIYLYPVPASVETMYIESLKLLQSLTTVTTTISLPGEYEEAIIYNLAVRLAPEYEMPIPIEVAALAASSLKDITILNAANQVEKVPLDAGITIGGGRSYNINSDY